MCIPFLVYVYLQELLTAHNCAEAFWVGNLKNRDIQVRVSPMSLPAYHTLPLPISLSLSLCPPLPVCLSQGQEILSQASQLNTTCDEDTEPGEVVFFIVCSYITCTRHALLSLWSSHTRMEAVQPPPLTGEKTSLTLTLTNAKTEVYTFHHHHYISLLCNTVCT